MSTYVSTDLPKEVTEQLQNAFAAAQTTLEQRTKESYERMIAATMEREQEISASWERPMLRLTQVLPDWIYPYIQQPDEKYAEWDSQSHESKYTYVPITVPGCNPIAAWVSSNTNDVRYEVFEPELRHDDEDDVWYVGSAVKWHRETVWGIPQLGDPDIAVTLFRAHDAYLKHLDLVALAEERNAYVPETLLVPAPEPEPDPAPAVPDTFASAGELLARYANGVNVTLRDDIAGVVVTRCSALCHHRPVAPHRRCPRRKQITMLQQIQIKYMTALRQGTELRPEDLGAVRLAMRMAMEELHLQYRHDLADMDDIIADLLQQRDQLKATVAMDASEILRLQTMEDRLIAWMHEHAYDQADALVETDTATVIMDMLSKAGGAVVSPPAAPVAVNANGNGNGHVQITDLGTRYSGRRLNISDDELHLLVIDTIRHLAATLGHTPTKREWAANMGPNTPSIPTITDRLRMKWSELVAAAGLEQKDQEQEAQADDSQATFRDQ